MKRILFAIIVFLLAVTTARAATMRGVWAIEPRGDSTVHLNLFRDGNHHGSTFPMSAFRGLTEAQMAATTDTVVRFRLEREAGTIDFDGVFRQREGSGHFTFAPSPAYLGRLRAMGIKTGDDNDDDRLFNLTVLDVSTAYIKSMIDAGYRVSLDDYVSMRIFRITPELIADYRALGYDRLSHDDLVTMQIHKATPTFIREMRALGYTNLSADQLVTFRIHRVTPQTIAEYRALGYNDLTADQLVSMRIHRVTPEFIRDMQKAGYDKVPIDKLISMRIAGVDAAFVNKMNGNVK